MDHPIQNINEDIFKGITSQHSLSKVCNLVVFVSQNEPNEIDESIIEEHWFFYMQERLNQFERNKFWELAPKAN